jgi:RNA polymerase sigma factor (sigma-70 family)
MSTALQNDADLVRASLTGNRDAFGQIVARYQSLVCSLAFSATGSLSQSEDLAQETFVTAWKQLAGLREPEKLRSWLCRIARNLTCDALRQQGREPSHRAEPLEEIAESHSPEPLPTEQTISNEEQAILWRSLEKIPEIYREPLVLFYREHQSIGAVAQNLELSEEAVKQRLSRGRKLLHEEVLAFVEGALEKTNPGKVFTIGVLAALPAVLTTSAKAATLGAAAAKSSAAVKATGLTALFQVILKIMLPLGTFVSLGGWLGYKMGGDAGQSPSQRNSVTRFWIIMVGCLFLFVLLPIVLWPLLMVCFGSKENLLAGMRTWLDIMFAMMAVAFGLWLWQRRKSRRLETAGAGEKHRTFFIWSVVLAMILAASMFALAMSDSNWKVERISVPQAQKLIMEKGGEAQFYVLRFPYHSVFKNYPGYSNELMIKLQEAGKLSKFMVTADDATLALLAEKGIPCPIYIQGRDFEVFGWQGKLLMGLFLLIFPAGAAVLLTLWLKNKSTTPIMTKGTKIGIVAAVVLAALIVTPLVWLNHRKVNSVEPNRVSQQTLTPERAAQAKQTAKEFFEALEKSDWNHVDKVCPPGHALSATLDDQTKNMLNGLTLVSLGEPFTKSSYPGVFVPYEIQFKNGESKKYNLAVRQDNPEQKWYWDGGL